MSAKEKKPHNIDETMIKRCILKAAGLVSRKTKSKKMAKILVLDFKSKHELMNSRKTLRVKFLKNYKFTFFSLQSYQTTDCRSC